jgi:hypothetical protein
MFKKLSQVEEIRSYLENFPSFHWKTVIEAICLFGTRELKRQKMPATLKTIEEILSCETKELQQTLHYMKHELKHLTSAIKRIERKTQSSADLFKDITVPTSQSKHRPELKPRNSSSNLGQSKAVPSNDRSFTPNYVSFQKNILEPKVCPLNDAQEIMKQVNSPKFLQKPGIQEISVELLKSKASHSTQETSPKHYAKAPLGKNLKFRKNNSVKG